MAGRRQAAGVSPRVPLRCWLRQVSRWGGGGRGRERLWRTEGVALVEASVLLLGPALHAEDRGVALRAPVLHAPDLEPDRRAAALPLRLGLRGGQPRRLVLGRADVLDVRVLDLVLRRLRHAAAAVAGVQRGELLRHVCAGLVYRACRLRYGLRL